MIASVIGSLLHHHSIYTEALGLDEHGPAASAAKRRTILPRAVPFHLRVSGVAEKHAEEVETSIG